jgi:transcriptional regulator with XRE-family HTH domain
LGQKLRRKAFPQAVKTIGDLLRKHRLKSGLKLKELALLLMVTNNLATQWEHDLASPTPEQWMCLAQWLKLPSTISEAKSNS